MSSFTGQIDYDALAAALIKAGSVPGASNSVVSVAPVTKGGPASLARDDAISSLGGSEESWSDAAEREEAEAAAKVEVEVVPALRFSPKLKPVVVSDDARKVKFGGMSDRHEGLRTVVDVPKSGFFADVVRGARARALGDLVREFTGHVLPKAANWDRAVCTFTAGTMPDALHGGKDRLRALAALGDAVISVHVVASVVAQNGRVESVQQVRSKVTSDAALRAACVGMGLVSCVAFPPGVDPATSKPAATAFEAVVGLLAVYREEAVVLAFLRGAQILA